MFIFPWSNLHELNLDWILQQVKQFAELIPPMSTAVEDVQALQTDVEQAVEDANAALEDASAALETAEEAKDIAEQAAQGTIADGAVTTAKIANGAVTAEKIGTGAVTTTQILDGTISPDDLGVECVTQSKLGAASVATTKIQDNAVTMQKIDDLILSLVSNVIINNTASVNIASGQYAIVKNSSISGCPDGIYKVVNNITAETPITSVDLQAINNGISNELKNYVDTFIKTATINVNSDSAGNITIFSGSIHHILNVNVTSHLACCMPFYGYGNTYGKVIGTGTTTFDVVANAQITAEVIYL